MPRIVDGSSSILQGVRFICRLAGRFGVARFGAKTTPEMAAAVTALMVACAAFDALDDYPGEIDRTPGGPGDAPPFG